MVKVNIRAMKLPVTVGPLLKETGWYGGQWVQFVGKKTVEVATPEFSAGFLMIGYKLKDFDGKPYNYDYSRMDSGVLPFVPYQFENKAIDAYGQTVLITDMGYYDFNSNVYDTAQVYQYNRHVYVNNNGFLTSVNTGFSPVGIVVSAPQDNNGWLGIIVNGGS